MREGPVGEGVFVGREAELSAIVSYADTVRRGRAGVVWIDGDAGSGKTALARQVISRLTPSFSVLQAEASELARDVPFEVVSQLGPIATRTPFAAGLELLALLSSLQDSGPLVVAVEDLHWADAPSSNTLLTVAQRLDEDRVLMLLTSRDVVMDENGWDRFRLDHARCLLVKLGGLSVSEVSEMARLWGIRMPQRSAERLHRHTKGHPLYVRTLLGELGHDQLTAPEGELSAPRSLVSTAVARLAEATPDARALGSALATLNQRVTLQIAGRVARVPRPAQALESLLSTGLVNWSPGGTRTLVEFVHPLYRAAVYEQLSPTYRQQLHQAAGELLDREAALAHRVAAADYVDHDLAEELADASRRALAKGSLAMSAQLLLWSSSLSGFRATTECRLLEAARLLLDDHQTARVATMRHQLEACSDTPLRSLVLAKLAWDLGDSALCEHYLTGSFATERASEEDRDVTAAGLALLAEVYATRGLADRMADASSKALSFARPGTEVEREAWSWLAVATAMLRGGPAGLSRLAERLPQPADEVPPAEVNLLVYRGMLGFYSGRTTGAIADLRQAVHHTRHGAEGLSIARAHVHLARLMFHSGDWDEGTVHAHVALSLIPDERTTGLEPQAHAALGILLGSRGDWGAAAEHVRLARELLGDHHSVESEAAWRIAEAALAKALGQPEQVIAVLTPMGPTWPNLVSPLTWSPALITAILETGDVDGAARRVNELEQAAQMRGLDLRARIVGLRAQVADAWGRGDDAIDLFGRALALLGPDDPLLDRALMHHAFGRSLHAGSAHKEALDQLRAAHKLLAGVGAVPYLQRVEVDLQACGIRVNAQTTRSPLDLTDRESDVVALVKKGMTNREVAAELYLSDKTVEYHLRNVFGKLGITSRRELRVRQLS